MSTDQGGGNRFASVRAASVLVPMGVVLLALTFLASPGLFNIDEAILLAGAKAFLSSGGFAVDNGWSTFASPDQTLWILVAGPNGLTPQYPVGSAIVGGPLLALFGAHGLMLPNVAAGIGTLVAVWALAKRHLGGRDVALAAVMLLFGATFWLEYVYAVWPHSVGVLAVTLALLLLLDCLDADSRFDLKAATAGAAIGVGFLFRTDTALALPALGLIAILFAKRPFRIGAVFGLGLAPFIALAAAANYVKFGVLNPASYGKAAGGTSASSYLVLIAVLGFVALVLVSLRFVKWRPGRREYAIGAAAAVLAIAAVPALRELAWRYLVGAWALLVDATIIQDPRPGMQAQPGGLLTFWGLWKKALGQSMPWLGLLFLIPFVRKDEALRRMLWVALVFVGVWSLPFFVRSWHGGMGSNMRYFLPVIPLLCVLSARLLIDFARPVANAPRILLLGALAGGIAIAAWAAFHPTHAGGAQQILSTWILAAIAGLAVMSGVRWRGQDVVRVACLGAIGAGLAASTFFLAADIRQAQAVRTTGEAFSTATANMPNRAVVYAPTRFISHWTFKSGHIAALPGRLDDSGRWDDRFDYGLIDRALEKNYRVLIWSGYVNDGLRERYGIRLRGSGETYLGNELLEVAPDSGGTIAR